MRPSRIFRFSSLAGLTLALGACVSVPVQFQGEYPPLAPKDARSSDSGTAVRWGGVILETRPEASSTCFELLGKPLSSSMRPTASDQSTGRFIACKSGFHDPEVFVRGREATLTGRLERIDVRKVGDFDYRYPVVSIEFMTMWPERKDVIFYDYDPFFSPWYWYYPYYYYSYPPVHRHPVPRQRDQGPRVDLPPASTDPSGQQRN